MTKNKNDKIKLIKLLKEKKKRKARSSHMAFIDYTWQDQTEKFQTGFHTKITCDFIDRAMDNFEKGISTFACISMHPRTGKSLMSSKTIGPHFIGRFPGTEVMLSSYGTDLSTEFSEYSRNLAKTEEFRQLYPDCYLPFDAYAKSNWKLLNKKGLPGSVKAMGLRAGLNGKGYHLGILDDFIKNKEQAGNPDLLKKLWEAFVNDFLTRRAPVSITLVVATQWDPKDIIGLIKKQMKIDPDFPEFEILSFPAKAKDYKGPGEYPNEYLFMERFSKKYYLQQYATLGKRSAAALYDCDPRVKGGEILSTEHVEYVDRSDPRIREFKRQKFRVWDLAHTAKERAKDDPDYTSGTLLSYVPGNSQDPVPHLWVFDVVRCQENATKRDELIRRTAKKDGVYVKQAVETSMDSKDAYYYLRKAMPDIKWKRINLQGKGDKLVRATPLEPIFEAPYHVHIVRGLWNDDWIEEVESFNGDGKGHDDQIDNLSSGYIIAIGSGYKPTDEQKAAIRKRNS